MDIGSNGKWPSCALSNFAAHEFTIDGVRCASMEGFLQSLKHSNPEVQKEICTLVGIKAKRRGGDHWKRRQELYWQGKAYGRTSEEYQQLLEQGVRCPVRERGLQGRTVGLGRRSVHTFRGETKAGRYVPNDTGVLFPPNETA